MLGNHGYGCSTLARLNSLVYVGVGNDGPPFIQLADEPFFAVDGLCTSLDWMWHSCSSKPESPCPLIAIIKCMNGQR